MESRMVATGAGKWKKRGDAGQKVQDELWGSNVQRDDYGQ